MKKVSGQSSLTSNKQNFGWLLRLRIRVFAFPSECLSCHIRIAHLLWYSKADSHTAINCMPTEVPCLAASVRRRVPPDQVSACRLSDPSFTSRLYQLELSVLNLFPYCKHFFVIACGYAINFTDFYFPRIHLSPRRNIFHFHAFVTIFSRLTGIEIKKAWGKRHFGRFRSLQAGIFYQQF